MSLTHVRESRWNRYRVWKPLGLLALAALTPPEWEITVFDENVRVPDYPHLPRPDLVGVTAFTSQANRAYEIAAGFRSRGVPVVMGGIHATMCLDEAAKHVDAVVTGEAEGVWAKVLEDARAGRLQARYDGGLADIGAVPSARHDLTATGYAFGAIQTTRGCPLNCSFCSVTAFNGAHYRQRPVPDVVRELGLVREKYVLMVDDNLIGTRPEHIERAKDLFRSIARANLRKEWIGQAPLVQGFEATLRSIAENLCPDSLCLPGHHGVHAFRRLVPAHRGVYSAHDDGHAHSSELGGYLVRPVGLRGEGRDAYQIRPG